MRHDYSAKIGGGRVIRRRLLNITAVASLVLCAGTMVLWACSYSGRSFWLADPLGGLHINSADGIWVVCFYEGDLVVNHYLSDSTTRLSVAEHGWHIGDLIGYRYFAGRTQRWSTLMVALRVVVVITLVLPFFWVVKRIRRRFVPHVSTARCPACGYNLTANTSGVCPECGTPVVPRSATTWKR